jgi:hypothetical protein
MFFWNLLGYPLWRKRYRTNRQTVQVKILYVDCDLCISVDQGLDQPFTVDTKSPAWVARTEQLKRKWKKNEIANASHQESICKNTQK